MKTIKPVITFPTTASALGGARMVRYGIRFAKITLCDGRVVRLPLSKLPKRETWTSFNLADAAQKAAMSTENMKTQGMAALKKLPSNVLKRAVELYRIDHPGFWVPCRNKVDATLVLTDSCGFTRDEYQPYLKAAIALENVSIPLANQITALLTALLTALHTALHNLK